MFLKIFIIQVTGHQTKYVLRKRLAVAHVQVI